MSIWVLEGRVIATPAACNSELISEIATDHAPAGSGRRRESQSRIQFDDLTVLGEPEGVRDLNAGRSGTRTAIRSSACVPLTRAAAILAGTQQDRRQFLDARLPRRSANTAQKDELGADGRLRMGRLACVTSTSAESVVPVGAQNASITDTGTSRSADF